MKTLKNHIEEFISLNQEQSTERAAFSILIEKINRIFNTHESVTEPLLASQFEKTNETLRELIKMDQKEDMHPEEKSAEELLQNFQDALDKGDGISIKLIEACTFLSIYGECDSELECLIDLIVSAFEKRESFSEVEFMGYLDELVKKGF